MAITRENIVSASDVNGIGLKIYPIGSIYMSVQNISPASFIGGTWEALKDRFLLGAGNSYAVNATGGETSHTITTAEMPSHSHSRGTMNITGWIDIPKANNEWSYSKSSGALYESSGSEGGNRSTWSGTCPRVNLDASRNWTGNTSEVGSGSAHNNMPPYLAVYMWKRTA